MNTSKIYTSNNGYLVEAHEDLPRVYYIIFTKEKEIYDMGRMSKKDWRANKKKYGLELLSQTKEVYKK